MLQTPWNDMAVNNNPDSVRWTDPNGVWLTPTNCVKSDCFQKRNNLTPCKIESIILNLKPVTTHSYDDKGVTLLFAAFFSEKNFQNLQKMIRYSVYTKGHYRIGDQNESELIRIMESIYSDNENSIAENILPIKIVENMIKNEVKRLNDIVVRRSVNNILEMIKSRDLFLEQWDKNNIGKNNVDRPISTNVTGLKFYRTLDYDNKYNRF